MKIVLLGPAFPFRGGIADFNEAFAQALLGEGHDVVIYSFYFQYPKILFPGTSQVVREGYAPKLTIHSTLSSIDPFSWGRTAKKIADENADLVIIRYWLPFMAPALGTVAKKLRRKSKATAISTEIYSSKHEVRSATENPIPIPIGTKTANPFPVVIAITDNVIPHEKRVGDAMLTKYFVKQCDGFITMSKSVLNDLDKFISTDKKIFLPHPIYNIFGERIPKADARKALDLAAGERIILFFGFIRKYKGLHLLLDAMADPRMKERNIRLLVAGEFYDDKTPYLAKINSTGISSSVILHTSFIDKSKVRNYFCAADLVVQPYLEATQSGITQIAYHFGRPMLVTNTGGLAEIVSDRKTGYVTSRSPESLVDAICDYFDAGREQEFSVNVDAEKEKFSWKYFINGMKELYERIRKQ